MIPPLSACWACAIVVSLLSCTGATETEEIARANGDFAIELYKALKSSSKNLFYSPMSISSALGMTYAGANGDTKSQMEEVLGFNSLGADTNVHSAFKSLLDALSESANNYTLNIANRLFGRQDYAFLSTFEDTLRNYYGAAQETLDFEGDPEGSRMYINEWVESQTNDKIKDLLPQGSINKDIALVLVNAIYFKGLWKLPFDPQQTAKKPFYITASNSMQMDMMSLGKKYFNYYEHSEWDCAILELPYEGNKASMVILLPNTRDGIGLIEENINIDDLTTAINNLRSEEVVVTIPKFKLTQRISLKAYLSVLGMEDLFSAGEADLSGMNGGNDLYVTEVMHKAYVDVNEEGTEAAGATGVIVGITSIQPDPKVFLADRPFMFLLRDRDTGSILFLGRLAEPPEEAGASVGTFGAGPRAILDGSGGHKHLAPCLSLVIIAIISYVSSDLC